MTVTAPLGVRHDQHDIRFYSWIHGPARGESSVCGCCHSLHRDPGLTGVTIGIDRGQFLGNELDDPNLAGCMTEAVALLTQAMNAHIEAWIRERPAEWLWLHRRFDKAIYRRA